MHFSLSYRRFAILVIPASKIRITMIISPLSASRSNGGMLKKVSSVEIRVIIAVPITVPETVPLPPVMLVPPTTAAAIRPAEQFRYIR
jgi:hypothetical protein